MPGQLVKAMYWMFNRRVNVAHKLLRYSTSEKRMSTKLMSPTTVNAFMQVLMIGIRPRTVHCVWSPVAVQCAALNLLGGVQKTKLLMLREYVNKTEKMGGTWTNTNSYRENEALSDIFSPEIFYVTIVSCLNILWPGTSAGFWLGASMPRCRLRRIKFGKFDYKMVHSEVYLNKYVVSMAVSTPVCPDCSQNIT